MNKEERASVWKALDELKKVSKDDKEYIGHLERMLTSVMHINVATKIAIFLISLCMSILLCLVVFCIWRYLI